jgi:hypothetical protein
VLIQGDLSPLTPEQRLDYYKAVCKSLGLNTLTVPFGYILFKDKEADNAPAKLALYAKKDCAEQLRKIHRVSVVPGTTKRLIDEDYATVEIALRDATGRTDVATGMVYLWKKYQGKSYRLTGQRLADAVMKAETKAKRRGTLSICGLGILDEMDLESIRVVGGVTPDGRIFRLPEPSPDEPPPQLVEGLPHAYQAGSTKAKEAEETLRRVEEADRAIVDAKKTDKVVPQQPETNASPAQPESHQPAILEAEKTAKGDFIVRGDVQASEGLWNLINTKCVFLDGWWHCTEPDLREIAQQQVALNFRIKGVPARAPDTGGKKEQPATKTAPAARPQEQPELVTGTIERVTASMTAKNNPTRQVKIAKAWYTSYVNPLFDFLDKGVGKEAEMFVDARKNIVGLKRIGRQEFDADGRTPVVQRGEQEPGRSLFGA